MVQEDVIKFVSQNFVEPMQPDLSINHMYLALMKQWTSVQQFA